ncbi:hypothetical protein EW146_g8385 [Bondarzewia mesenterica]|uniref:LysM domain-containing protein n=1 Tax=Bondarzewia mesenterica TaxID=1095465 RepID=A0A4S4LEQ5_9AGAM|nr:hypothetical protein EW146_g8385 [Bondarzewia mesenterica]
MFSILAALAAVPLFAQSVFAGPCVRSYTIQEGDICDSISAAKNVSTYQLAVINEGVINSACTNLTPGNSICIGYQGEDCSTTYVVRADDTCDLVTSKTGVNSTLLYLNNPQIDQACSNLYIGEVLCTSSTVQVPPAPGNGYTPAETIPVTATPAVPSVARTFTLASTTTYAPVYTSPAPTSSSSEEDLPWCDEL